LCADLNRSDPANIPTSYVEGNNLTHHADEDSAVYQADECLQQKAGESKGCVGPAFCPLQLCAGSWYTADHSRYGGRHL